MTKLYLLATLLLSNAAIGYGQDAVFTVKQPQLTQPVGIIEYQSGERTAAPGRDRIEHYRLIVMGNRKIFEQLKEETNWQVSKSDVSVSGYQPTLFGIFDLKVLNNIYTIVAGDTNQVKTEIPLFSLSTDSVYYKAANWHWKVMGYNIGRADTSLCTDTAAEWTINGKNIACYKVVANGFLRGDINGRQTTTTYIDKTYYLPVAVITEFDPRGVEQNIKFTPQQEKLWLRRSVMELRATTWID